MQIARENNDPDTEMYMALFEQSLNCSQDLTLCKDPQGVWLYENETTMKMYSAYISGSQDATQDFTTMIHDGPSYGDMWADAGNLVMAIVVEQQAKV